MIESMFESDKRRFFGPHNAYCSQGVFRDDLGLNTLITREGRRETLIGCSMTSKSAPIKSLGEYLERRHFIEDVRCDMIVSFKQAAEDRYLNGLRNESRRFLKKPNKLELQCLEQGQEIAMTRVSSMREGGDSFVPKSVISIGDKPSTYHLLKFPTCSTGGAVHASFNLAFKKSVLELCERQNKLLFWDGLQPINVAKTSLHEICNYLGCERALLQLKDIDLYGDCYLVDCSFIEGSSGFVLLYSAKDNPYGLHYGIGAATSDSIKASLQACLEEFLLSCNGMLVVNEYSGDLSDLKLDFYDQNYFSQNKPSTLEKFNLGPQQIGLSKLLDQALRRPVSFDRTLDSMLELGELFIYHEKLSVGQGDLHFTKAFGDSFYSGLNYAWGESVEIARYFGISDHRRDLIPFP